VVIALSLTLEKLVSTLIRHLEGRTAL